MLRSLEAEPRDLTLRKVAISNLGKWILKTNHCEV